MSETGAPGYLDVTKKPMCWKVIDEKLDKIRMQSLFLGSVIISVILSRISTSIRKISILFLIML